MLVVLRNVCQEAVQADKITKHCLDGIPLARREDAHDAARFCPVTRDQLETMADRLGAHGLTVWLMYGAGLRVSEALAMTAGDVCGSYIRVRRQIDRAGKLVPLKGRSAGDYRDVPCPGWLAEKITAHLDAYPAGSDGRMFTMVYRDYWTKFRLAAVRAGLPDEYSPHWLRHLFASVMLAAGVPITDLAKWLGHRDPKVTFDTYGHLMPDNMERARQASDAAWQAA